MRNQLVIIVSAALTLAACGDDGGGAEPTDRPGCVLEPTGLVGGAGDRPR